MQLLRNSFNMTNDLWTEKSGFINLSWAAELKQKKGFEKEGTIRNAHKGRFSC